MPSVNYFFFFGLDEAGLALTVLLLSLSRVISSSKQTGGGFAGGAGERIAAGKEPQIHWELPHSL